MGHFQAWDARENVKKSYFHALAGTTAPRQPMYRRRATQLVAFILAPKPPDSSNNTWLSNIGYMAK